LPSLNQMLVVLVALILLDLLFLRLRRKHLWARRASLFSGVAMMAAFLAALIIHFVLS
jgi:hypothetical protein